MMDVGARPLHFLVVDDDEGTRAQVIEYLKTLGYQKISQAHNGAEAIRMLDRDVTINFIVSDWEMPLVNGIKLLQRIRNTESTAHIPFLIITSPVSAENEKVLLAAENTVDAYMIKPFRRHTFQHKIDEMLSRSIHGPQKEVIVADDDLDAREMVVEYLERFGFKYIKDFTDGKKALEYIQKNVDQVGLIISDWEMPELNGVEFLKAVKTNKKLEKIPFLMITSQTSMERMKVVQAARANVDQYLLKPFTGTEIKQRIDKILARNHNRSQVQKLTKEAAEHAGYGRYERAATLYEQALQLDPSYDIALRGLGDVYMKYKGLEAALPLLRQAIDLNPYNIKNYLALATAYEKLDWVEKAIALLRSGISQISFSPELHFQLGRLYHRKGQDDQARSEFEKTLEIQLDHQEARLMIEMLNRSD